MAILVMGSVIVDDICRVDKLPAHGEGAIVQERVRHLGGCAFNSARMISQLGRRVKLFAPVGHGPMADFARGELAAAGLEGAEVETDLDCGSCLCLVEPGGERTMLTMPGIDRYFDDAWFEGRDFSNLGIGIVAGYEIDGPGGEAIVRFLEKHKYTMCIFAPGPRITSIDKSLIKRINALQPIWHLNDLEARQYTGCDNLDEACERIACEGIRAAVVTEGAAGARICIGNDDVPVTLKVATQPVEVVDTVGAGDAHVAGFAAALDAGLRWEPALMLANRCASAVCQVEGGSLTDAQAADFGIGALLS